MTSERASGFIEVGGQQLHFLQFGCGPSLVVAFPGYGMSAESFGFLEQESFTVLSFELPHSGESVCAPGFVFKKKDLGDLISALASQWEVQKVSLAGFSIGGRICLSAMEAVPELISSVVIAAPDGTGKEWFYRFITRTAAGRFFFRRFVDYGERYIRLLEVLHFLKLLPNYKFRFVMQYVRTREARERVRNIWHSLSDLLPNLSRVADEATNRKVPIHILAGNNDSVIPLRNLRRFAARGSAISLHLFERGHNLLQFEEVRGMFSSRLRKP